MKVHFGGGGGVIVFTTVFILKFENCEVMWKHMMLHIYL